MKEQAGIGWRPGEPRKERQQIVARSADDFFARSREAHWVKLRRGAAIARQGSDTVTPPGYGPTGVGLRVYDPPLTQESHKGPLNGPMQQM